MTINIEKWKNEQTGIYNLFFFFFLIVMLQAIGSSNYYVPMSSIKVGESKTLVYITTM